MATSAFTKFDPRAFLESEPRTGAAAKPANPAKVDDDRAPTLAALATLAGAPAEIHDPRPTDNVWTDAQEERAAIVEHDGGMRRPWAEAMARLDPARVPANMSQERWAQFIDDCGRFLDQGWATHAEGLGWGPLDLFGCDRERSPAEGDHAGLLWRQAHHHVRICGHHRDGNRTANDVSPSQQPSRRAGPGVGARSRPGAVRQPTPIYRGLRTSARMLKFVMASIAALAVLEGWGLLRGRAGGRSTDTGKKLCPPMNPSCRSCHGRGRR